MIASSQIIWIGVEPIQMEPSIPAQTRRLRLQAASGQRIWTGFYGSIKSAGSVLLKLAAVYFGVCYWLRLAMRACMLPPHVTECDAQIQAQLQALHVREDEPAKIKQLLFCKFSKFSFGCLLLCVLRASWSGRFLRSSTPHLVRPARRSPGADNCWCWGIKWPRGFVA